MVCETQTMERDYQSMKALMRDIQSLSGIAAFYQA